MFSQNKWVYISIASLVVCLFTAGFVFFYTGRTVDTNEENNAQKQLSENFSQVEGQPEVAIGIEEKVIEDQKKNITILAVGDMMLDRTVYLHTLAAQDFRHPFAMISSTLLAADLTVGNLEGPVTDFTSVANGEGSQRLIFTFSPKFVEPLTTYFDVVSLANNHTNNFGSKGLAQARSYLGTGNLLHFGDPWNTTGHISVTTTVEGVRIGFVGFHELIGYGFDSVLAEVRDLRKSVDILIAYPHWGAEYNTTRPTATQKQEGYDLIDAGVDIVVGMHPHVIQPIEIYNGKVIFYSLGNFIFDQYFSVETMEGLTAQIQISKDIDRTEVARINLLPIEINTKSQPALASEETRQRIFDHLAQYSIADDVILEQVRQGFIEL